MTVANGAMIDLNFPQVVPEPGSVLLAAGGAVLAALGLRSRRRLR